MKVLKAWLNNHRTIRLLALCYAVALVLALCVHVGRFVYSQILRTTGALQTLQLTIEDFELVDLYLLEDGSYATISADPQMLLRNTALRVESVTMEMQVSGDGVTVPLMVSAYYANEGEGYSARQIVYAACESTEGSLPLYSFSLPVGGAYNLRIDPDIAAGRMLTFGTITINAPRTLGSYFVPTAGEAWLLLVVPALLACGLSLLPSNWRPLQRRGAAHG